MNKCSCHTVVPHNMFEDKREFTITLFRNFGKGVDVGPGKYVLQRCKRCGGYLSYTQKEREEEWVTVWPEDDPNVLERDTNAFLEASQ